MIQVNFKLVIREFMEQHIDFDLEANLGIHYAFTAEYFVPTVRNNSNWEDEMADFIIIVMLLNYLHKGRGRCHGYFHV